ncbi:Choline_kinase domain-containing protein, partial [Cephalotus follicularis]
HTSEASFTVYLELEESPFNFCTNFQILLPKNKTHKKKMARGKKIYNAMEIAEEADIKSSSLTVDTSLSLSDMKPRVLELCKDLFNQWSTLDDSRFFVETIAGGITNLLLKVTVKEENGENVAVTVRLYGPNTEYLINRQKELEAIKYLSVAGFGAKLLGVFGNGMVQSFIDARTLTPPDMRLPKLAAEIAKQLRKFHEVEIPGLKEAQLWIDISKFFEKASTLKFDDIEKQRMYKTISFKEIHIEVVELQQELTCHLNSPVVFAHNDLLSGNLMLNDEREELYLIDFEYGSYNYRGYDIGNHFNEYAGYECDYNLYPNKDEQYHFFRHYLQPDKPEEVSDKDLEVLYVETNTYMLASHLYWALWALIQAKMSPIDFDYLGYFFLRYNEYKSRKEMCFSLAQAHLSKSGAS